MNPARELTPEMRIAELPAIGLGNKLRDTLSILLGTRNADIDTFGSRSRANPFQKVIGRAFFGE
jgi:hypothetical protein